MGYHGDEWRVKSAMGYWRWYMYKYTLNFTQKNTLQSILYNTKITSYLIY